MMHRTLGRSVFSLPLFLFALLLPAAAQISPAPPAPLQPTPPQGSGTCSVNSSCADLAPQIIHLAESPSSLEENLRYLTDVIGGRPSGSPAAAKAAAWAVAAFRKAGVDSVHTERFTIPNGWSEGASRLEILSPDPFPVRLVSIGWGSPTPRGGIKAAIVDVGDGSEEAFRKAGTKARGTFVLVSSKELETLDGLFQEYARAPEIIERAGRVGAAGILWMGSRSRLLLYRHSDTADGRVGGLPQAIIAREDALRIARFLAAGTPVVVWLSLPNRVTGPVSSQNVVAEIRGREKPGEFVVLGAHLDSWELGTGALDNGCNAALVIDAARVLHALGVRPRRSVRFVLFTGEEQGMLGSWAYARAHRAELDRMIAAVIIDEGSGRVTGLQTAGRTDIAAALRAALAPAAPLGPLEVTNDADLGTDNYDFVLEGVPGLVVNQEPANYMLNYHAMSDTFDKVDFPMLRKNEALCLIVSYALADAPARLGPRQSRAEIGALLESSGLAQQMKALRMWDQWASGARGRPLK